MTMIPSRFAHMGAQKLADAIARGEISAVEAVEAHIRRIEAVNDTLNAVVVRRYDAALAEAKAADARRKTGAPLGPLHGVPITVKESLDLAGTPATFGLPSRAQIITTQDDPYVARLREAGAIVVGKTNVAQLLMYLESDNPLYGRSNNPWNPERSPGGSSGGEAAIIAAGGSPLGIGTDLGGSLRVPATFCGIASMKPTAGRTPDVGRYSAPLGEQAIVSQTGILAREVRDVALGLAIINGDYMQTGEPARPLGDAAAVDIASLRVAYYTDDGTFTVAPAVRRAVEEAAKMLEQVGAQVIAWEPPAVPYAQELFLGLLSADGGTYLKRLLKHDKRDPRVATLAQLAGLSPALLAIMRRMLRLAGQPSLAQNLRAFGYRDTSHYWDLVEAQASYRERFATALDDPSNGGPFDVILSPACALPAFTHGATKDVLTAGAYTTLYNVLGYPAGVVPVTRVRAGEESDRRLSRDIVQKTAAKVETGSAGLPVGVQVIARPWREHVALAAMQVIESMAQQKPDFPHLPGA